MNKKDIRIYNEYLKKQAPSIQGKKLETFYVDFDKVVKIGDSTDLISVEFVGFNTLDSNMTDDEIKKLVSPVIQDYITIHQPIRKPIDKDDFFTFLFLKSGWLFNADEVNICKVLLAERGKEDGNGGNDNGGTPPPAKCELQRIFFDVEAKNEDSFTPPTIEL